MITRVGIDPGVHECGVAIECDDSNPSRHCMQRIAFLAAGTLPEMLDRVWGCVPGEGSLHICVEGQQIYRSENSKGDPNDMINVAQVAGAMLGMLLVDHAPLPTVYKVPLPRTWKGSLPKKQHHSRLARDFPYWVAPVKAQTKSTMQHHVWDAVGLLEWHRKQTQ